MLKFATRSGGKGLLALVLVGAIGGNATYAQNAPRVELSAEAGATRSTVTTGLDSFPAASEIDQLKGFSEPLTPTIQFLRTYYKLGRNAQREELLKLYSPEMRGTMNRQFADTKTVATAFADLGDVDVDSAITWGFYRVILVNHHSKSNPRQVFPWVHTIACQSRCVFVDESELAQKASYLFYLSQFNKHGAAPVAAKTGNLKLALYPVFSDKSALPGLMSDPLELNLVEADVGGKGAGAALLAKLLKYPDAGAALAEAEKTVFDRGTPKAYPRKVGDGKTVDMVAWAAYLDRVRSKTWPSVQTYRLRADTAILIARSENNDVLFLAFHRVGNGWRLYTNPSEAPFWPLFEGRPFAEAFGKLYKKPG